MLTYMDGGSITWTIQTPDPIVVDRLQSELGCSQPIATILANRGFTEPGVAEQFLQATVTDGHDPFLLPDLDVAIDRLIQAIEGEEVITVYADRDIDGIAGAAILLRTCVNFGATVGYHVPGKYDKNGLREGPIRKIAQRGTDLLLAVDCGTTNHHAVDEANSAGMDVIILDHHQPAETLPNALACVNPRRAESQYPHDALSAGGVAFQTGRALIDTYEPVDGRAFTSYATPLAALATVGDRARMTVENRGIVRSAFSAIDQVPCSGIEAAVDFCDIQSIRDLGWELVPLLNAAQEDPDGDLLVELLLLKDKHRAAAILTQLSTYREKIREQRKSWVEVINAAVADQCDVEQDPILFIELDEFVDGAARSRVAERFNKPLFVLRNRNNRYNGYGRSTVDVDLIELLHSCGDVLEKRWGHPGAAGFAVTSGDIGTVKERLVNALLDRYDPTQLQPRVEVDTTITPSELTVNLVDEIEGLRPFGSGYPEPTFMIESLDLAGIEPLSVDSPHVRVQPVAALDVGFIMWNVGDDLGEFSVPDSYHLIGNIAWDSFEERPAFHIDQLDPA